MTGKALRDLLKKWCAAALALLMAFTAQAPLFALEADTTGNSISADTATVRDSTGTAEEPVVSTDTAPGEELPAISSGTANGLDEVNSALSEMNYKIEVMQKRYLGLNQDLEEIRTAVRDQRRLLNEQILLQIDPKKFDSLEAEISQIRSDLAQTRQELSLLNKSVEEKTYGHEKKDFWHSPWVAVGALGLSIIALFAH